MNTSVKTAATSTAPAIASYHPLPRPTLRQSLRQSLWLHRSKLQWVQSLAAVAAFVLCTTMVFSCDPYQKTQCAWYITPFPEGNPSTPPGMVSLCVSNFDFGRRACYFVAEPKLVDRFNGVAFRYSEMVVEAGFPKRITSLHTCSKPASKKSS